MIAQGTESESESESECGDEIKIPDLLIKIPDPDGPQLSNGCPTASLDMVEAPFLVWRMRLLQIEGAAISRSLSRK